MFHGFIFAIFFYAKPQNSRTNRCCTRQAILSRRLPSLILGHAGLSSFYLLSRRRVYLSGSRIRLYLIIPFGTLTEIAAASPIALTNEGSDLDSEYDRFSLRAGVCSKLVERNNYKYSKYQLLINLKWPVTLISVQMKYRRNECEPRLQTRYFARRLRNVCRHDFILRKISEFN